MALASTGKIRPQLGGTNLQRAANHNAGSSTLTRINTGPETPKLHPTIGRHTGIIKGVSQSTKEQTVIRHQGSRAVDTPSLRPTDAITYTTRADHLCPPRLRPQPTSASPASFSPLPLRGSTYKRTCTCGNLTISRDLVYITGKLINKLRGNTAYFLYKNPAPFTT